MRADQADPIKLVALIEEAHHAARLAHPNVVSVLDLARDAENRPYLVMEHVDGIDLATLIETGPLPHPVAIFVVRELLSGLGYIHEDEVEDAARRLVALRNWGVSEGAKRLKITHGALSRWTRRRKIPT